jgi:N-acetylmuramoyl-L-alanine amidase-like protein
MQGEELSGCNAWFHNVAARVSAHFGVGRDGTADQWVQLNEVAWACGDYNEVSVSIEHAGYSGQKLTAPQLAKSLEILKELHARYPEVPLVWNEDPNGTGVTPHGCLGVEGGNHPNCPGLAIERQYNKALHKMARGSRVVRNKSVRKVP